MLDYIQKEIRRTIEDHTRKAPGYDEDIFTLGRAIGLLNMMEGFGMLPPSVCIRKDGGLDSAKHAAHFHMNKDVHYWEDEDA
jgi:hypothetical protein